MPGWPVLRRFRSSRVLIGSLAGPTYLPWHRDATWAAATCAGRLARRLRTQSAFLPPAGEKIDPIAAVVGGREPDLDAVRASGPTPRGREIAVLRRASDHRSGPERSG